MGKAVSLKFGAIATLIVGVGIVTPADAKVCRKPDKTYIGVANQLRCPKGTTEVYKGPGRGFLGLFPGLQINYETALAQANQKTSLYWKKQGGSIKRSTPEELRQIEAAQTAKDYATNKRQQDAWMAENNRSNKEAERYRLEDTIKNDFSLSLTGVSQKVSSVSCKSTKSESIWICNIKLLGSEPRLYRIETDGSSWAGRPL